MMIELIISVILSLASPQAVSVDDLPVKYQNWLDMEAVYIISENERDIFLKLTNNFQRDRFIKEFWEQRDPTPGTEQNEFKEEHFKRIAYANKWLGRETRKPGWKTAQGRTYILLGEPRDKRNYHTDRILVPLEMWFYEVDTSRGLPPHFYVIFFKKSGVGELILYDPTLHGPGALIYLSAGESFEVAGLKIAEVDYELAQAAVSLVPSETGDIDNPRPTLSSVTLMAKLENLPNYNRDATYAERILRGEASVETTYAFVSEPPDTAFNVIKLGTGDSLVNYSFHFAPSRLQFGKYGEKVYASLEVIVTAKDQDENVILSRRKPLDLTFTGDRIEKLKQEGVSYEDHFLLLPGKYNINLTVRNKMTKIYYTDTRTVEIPSYIPQETTVLKPILFLKSGKGQILDPEALPPFAFHSVKIYPLLPNYVPTGNDIELFYQLTAPGMKAPGAKPFELIYRIIRKGDKQETSTALSESQASILPGEFNNNGTASIFSRFSTRELVPGEYQFVIFAKQGGEILSSNSADFRISPMVKTIEPIIYYGDKINFAGSQPVLAKADQLMNLGRNDISEILLKKAARSWPANNQVALMLSEALVKNTKMDEAINILVAASLRSPNEPEWKRELGILYMRVGKHKKCIAYFEQVRLLEGDSVEVLNLLGEAYRYTGNNAKAEEIWGISLKMRPGQMIITQRVKNLAEAEK